MNNALLVTFEARTSDGVLVLAHACPTEVKMAARKAAADLDSGFVFIKRVASDIRGAARDVETVGGFTAAEVEEMDSAATIAALNALEA